MRIFWKKDAKKSSQRRVLCPPDPRVVTSAYYYNFVKFISSAKWGILLSKQNKFCIFQILQLFFTPNSVTFVDKRRKNISCPRAQGTLATPLIRNEIAL